MMKHYAIETLAHPFLDKKLKRLFIDGKWVEARSGRSFESINPANGEVLANIAEGATEDIDLAVAAARRALEGPWGRFNPADRQLILLRLADLLEVNEAAFASLDTLDMGSPISRTTLFTRRAIRLLRYYAGQATSITGETIENSFPGEVFSYTVREPIGVVGAIIPWNAPISTAAWKIAPALAAGCTVVLKPSEEASLTSLYLAEFCEKVGLPPGVINVVPGFGKCAGAALVSHPGVNKISFTGSQVTGQRIVQASAGNLKRVTLELGGKSPNIVFSDADIEAAVPGAAMACFANSGQICSAGTRLFVEKKIYDEFTHCVAEFGRKLKVGNGIDAETQIGPLVSSRQLEKVLAYLDVGVEEGARTLSGGTRVTDGALAKGYFVPPTVFAGVQNDMRIAREEIFGPVLSAISFETVDEVVALANDSDFGLGGGVWTRDINKAQHMVRSLQTGSVWVNCYQVLDPAVPFGGYKMSGYGRESGRQHIEDYTNVKSVWIKSD